MTKYTRATPDDITRIWKQLWGDLTPEQVQEITKKEDDMNGYTRTIPLKTRLENLIEQIPQEFRARAAAECMQDDGNPHDFERYLTSYVMRHVWETNPADTAYALETGSIRTDSEIPLSDGFCDERLDTGLTEGEQIKDYFGNVKVTASDEWRKRHLNH